MNVTVNKLSEAGAAEILGLDCSQPRRTVRRAGTATIPATSDYVGSTVVMLRG